MKILKTLLTILAATALVWVIYWKAMGQDLNAFARQVLPMPIIGTIFLTTLVGGIGALIHRMVARRWMARLPHLLWAVWTLVTITFITFLATTTG